MAAHGRSVPQDLRRSGGEGEGPILSIIIVSFNTREILTRCLRSVAQEMAGCPHEVIVVDNASEDGSADEVERLFLEVRVLRNRENVGFSRANNQGAAASSGRYLLLLNSDTVLGAGFARAALAYMASHPNVGIMGPRLLNSDGTLQLSAYGRFPGILTEVMAYTSAGKWMERAFPERDFPGRFLLPKGRHGIPGPVAHLQGSCLLLRREAWEELGGLDEDFFLYREETDLCQRAWERGWEVHLNPAVEVTHLHKASARSLSDRGLHHRFQSHYLYFSKHGGWPRVLVSYLLILLYAHLGALGAAALSLLGSERARARGDYLRQVARWHRARALRLWRAGATGPS